MLTGSDMMCKNKTERKNTLIMWEKDKLSYTPVMGPVPR